MYCLWESKAFCAALWVKIYRRWTNFDHLLVVWTFESLAKFSIAFQCPHYPFFSASCSNLPPSASCTWLTSTCYRFVCLLSVQHSLWSSRIFNHMVFCRSPNWILSSVVTVKLSCQATSVHALKWWTPHNHQTEHAGFSVDLSLGLWQVVQKQGKALFRSSGLHCIFRLFLCWLQTALFIHDLLYQLLSFWVSNGQNHFSSCLPVS